MALNFAQTVTAIGGGGFNQHWHRFHALDVTSEPDIGVGSIPYPINGSTIVGSLSSRQAGPLLSGEVTYSALFNNARLSRHSWRSVTPSPDFNNGGSQGTILVWVNCSGAHRQGVVGGGSNSTSGIFDVFIGATGEVVLRMGISGVALFQFTATGVANNSVWHMIAITCNGSTPNLFYLDGLPISTSLSGTPDLGTATSTFTTHGWLGSVGDTVWGFGDNFGDSGPGIGQFLNGYASDLIMFSRALTAAEVLSLWIAAGYQASKINLVRRGNNRRAYSS